MQSRDSRRGGNTESSVLLSLQVTGLVWEKLCPAGSGGGDAHTQKPPEVFSSQLIPLWIGYFIYWGHESFVERWWLLILYKSITVLLSFIEKYNF